MAEIKAEEDYKNNPPPIAYDFKSVDAREHILYMNYNRVEADVDQLIVEVRQEFKKQCQLRNCASTCGICKFSTDSAGLHTLSFDFN